MLRQLTESRSSSFIHFDQRLPGINGVSESSSGASIHGVFIFTDRGDLLLSRLTASGYQELGHFHLLEPTADYGQRKMAWVPPAYSGQRVFARNDKELVCASLACATTNAPVK